MKTHIEARFPVLTYCLFLSILLAGILCPPEAASQGKSMNQLMNETANTHAPKALSEGTIKATSWMLTGRGPELEKDPNKVKSDAKYAGGNGFVDAKLALYQAQFKILAEWLQLSWMGFFRDLDPFDGWAGWVKGFMGKFGCYKRYCFLGACVRVPHKTYHEYYLPAHLLESVDTPFASEYISKLEIDLLPWNNRKASIKIMEDFTQDLMNFDNTNFINTVFLPSRGVLGFKIADDITDNYKQLLDGIDEDSRLLGKSSPGGVYKNADYHIVRLDFLSFLSNVGLGGILPGCHWNKSGFPYHFMSESPIGMLASRFPIISLFYPELFKESSLVRSSCMKARFSHDTPSDILGSRFHPLIALEGKSSKICMDGQYGPKGPFTNRVKTQYPVQALYVGQYRAAAAGTAVGNASVYPAAAAITMAGGSVLDLPWQTATYPPMGFYRFRDQKEGNLERDRYMVLGGKTVDSMDSFWDGDFFISKHDKDWGPETYELNEQPLGEKDNRVVGVHFRYIRCCERGSDGVYSGFPKPEQKW